MPIDLWANLLTDIEVRAVRRSSSTFSRELSQEVDHGVQRERVKPQIRVMLKFGDKDGNVIGKVQGIYRHDEKVEITSRRLSAMSWSLAYDQEADIIPYYYFLEKSSRRFGNQITIRLTTVILSEKGALLQISFKEPRGIY